MVSTFKSIINSQSFSNFFNLSLNQGINVLVALLITPYLFETLGDDQYGLVNLALTIMMLLSVLVNYGFHLNGPKRLALIINDSREQSALINEVIWTRLFLALVLIGALLIAIFYFGLFPNYGSILAFSSLILINEAFFPLFILQGFDRLSLLSKANAISKLLYIVAIFVLVNNQDDNLLVNLFFGASALIVNLSLMLYIYKKWKLKFAFASTKRVYFRLRENFQFFVSTIAGHVSVYGGFILLSSFVSDTELGRYALAQRVAFLLRMIPVFLTQSILQHASRLYDSDKEQFRNYLTKSYKGGLALTFTVGVVFSIAAPWIISVLAGEYIIYSSSILSILSFIPFFGMLNVINMVTILVAEQKEILAKATWITAIMMLVLSALGSYYFGGYGLAIALLLSELISFMVHYILLKKNTNS
ncbi:MAG: O-antigen/teichoic acid export membrane protein [Roseivirga sp.]